MKDLYVITGGSGGIGLACAKKFVGQHVLISDINEAGLAKAKEELEKLNIQCNTVICDISKKEDVINLAKKTEEIGGFKGLIHTAGVSGTAPHDLVFKVNIIGSQYLVDEFYKFADKGTAFILVASMNGHLIPANEAYDSILKDSLQEGFIEKMTMFTKGDAPNAYNFSKRGVHLLAVENAKRYGERGARVVSLSPGVINTPMAMDAMSKHPEQMNFMKSITPLCRYGEPEEIASVCEFLVGEGASYVTGCDIKVDGGVIAPLIDFANKQRQK